VTKKHFNVYRGPVDDVFLRLLGVATYVNLPFIVRVTADCPLVDKALVIEAIEEAGKFTQHWDCATTKGITPPGIDLEIFRVSSMSAIYKFLNTAEKEHISNAFANKSLGMVTTRLKLSDYALTRGNFLLDTLSDFLRISKFISEKDISLSTKEILYNLQA
jgi:spore coat polysaccharide biosynthesis protein SpsF